MPWFRCLASGAGVRSALQPLAVGDGAFLPWAAWFADLPQITQHLADTSRTTSVYGRPLLMFVAVVSLAVPRHPTSWLAGVPLLWPSTQLHYAAIAVPGLTPYLALLWCIPIPEVWLAATCVFAVYEYRFAGRRASIGTRQARQASPYQLPIEG